MINKADSLSSLSLCAALAVFWPTSLHAQRSDADLFTEARVALDKFHDCKAAAEALDEVSSHGKNDPIWIFFTAKAKECVGALDESLALYRKYDKAVPGRAEVQDKIGELEYKLRKKAEQDDALRAQREATESKLRQALGFWSWKEFRTNVSVDEVCMLFSDSYRQSYTFEESGLKDAELIGDSSYNRFATLNTKQDASDNGDECRRQFPEHQGTGDGQILNQTLAAKLTITVDQAGRLVLQQQDLGCEGDCNGVYKNSTTYFVEVEGNTLTRVPISSGTRREFNRP
ncbi:MAG: hypothetical protein ABSG79_07740 [Bryobacteraceae bacterium]|jgi:hypothetical protein